MRDLHLPGRSAVIGQHGVAIPLSTWARGRGATSIDLPALRRGQCLDALQDDPVQHRHLRDLKKPSNIADPSMPLEPSLQSQKRRSLTRPLRPSCSLALFDVAWIADPMLDPPRLEGLVETTNPIYGLNRLSVSSIILQLSSQCR